MVRRRWNGMTRNSKKPARSACGPRPTVSHYSMTSRTTANRQGMRNLAVLLSTVLILAVACQRQTSKTVVVYVSEDQVFSEPILKDFERDTGITVKSVFDTEEAKSTGVMNRLMAEKDNPQADVYWA